MKKSTLVPIKETALIALGELTVSLIVVAVFLIIQKFDYTVITGVALGSAVIILNFLAMSFFINRALDDAFEHREEFAVAIPQEPVNTDLEETDSEENGGDEDENADSNGADKPEEVNPELEAAMRFVNAQRARVQNISKISYIVRTFTILGALVLALLSGWFNAIATCVPMLMLRPIIMVEGLIRRKK